MVTSLLDPLWQRQRGPAWDVERGFADHDRTRPQQWRKQRRELAEKAAAHRLVVVPYVDMRESGTGGKALAQLGQCLAEIAENQPVGCRNAVGMRSDGALEDEDIAVRTDLAQMVEGAAIAEPEFEYGAGKIPGEPGCVIEAGARRYHARDKTVEATHRAARSNGGPKLLDFGNGRAQFLIARLEPVPEFPDDGDRDLRELVDEPQKQLLGDS